MFSISYQFLQENPTYFAKWAEVTIDKGTKYALNPTFFLQIMARELQLQTWLDPRLGEKEGEGGMKADQLTLADDGGAAIGWSCHARSRREWVREGVHKR